MIILVEVLHLKLFKAFAALLQLWIQNSAKSSVQTIS